MYMCIYIFLLRSASRMVPRRRVAVGPKVAGRYIGVKG